MTVCPFCGEKIQEYDITCLNCGKSLIDVKKSLNGNATNTSMNQVEKEIKNEMTQSREPETKEESKGKDPLEDFFAGLEAGGSKENKSDGNVKNENVKEPEKESEPQKPQDEEEKKTESKEPEKHSRISIGGGAASDLFGMGSSGSSSQAAGGYNPYGGGGDATTAAGGYNPYGGGGDATTAAGGYNPYGGGGDATTAAGGYNPYGGNTTPPPTPTPQPVSTSSSGSSDGGYNPYDVSDDALDPALKPLPSSMTTPQYGAYSSKSAVKNTKKVKNAKNKNAATSLIKGLIAAIIIVVGGYYLYPFIQGLSHRQYDSIAKKSVEQKFEEDKTKLESISAFKYDELFRELAGNSYDRMKESNEKKKAQAKQYLVNTYGDNYKISVEIKEVKGLTGDTKKEAVETAKTALRNEYKSVNRVVDMSEYINSEEISQAKRITLTAKVKGNKGSIEKDFTVDVIKFDSMSEWKLLGIYDA